MEVNERSVKTLPERLLLVLKLIGRWEGVGVSSRQLPGLLLAQK